MARIETGLHEHHARMAAGQAQTPGATRHVSSAPPTALEAPFAKVNSVVASSPADVAGLRAGDTITKFGWVDWTNHERLSRVAEAVAQNEGVSQLHNLPCSPNATDPHHAQGAATDDGRPGGNGADAAHAAAQLGRTGLVGLPSAAAVMVVNTRVSNRTR